MLKKSDLAKQFDLVVQQEIKNYQDSLNFLLKSLNELKESIKQVQDESLENHAMMHSMQTDLSIELHNLKDAFLNSYQNVSNHINDQRVINQKNQHQILDLTDDMLKKKNQEFNFQSKIKNLCEENNKLKETIEENNKILNSNLDDLLRRLRQEILKRMQEILDMPSEASAVKTQLEEKIASHKVDVEGITRELRIYKNDNMVTQKKIENIYTLIERLKKSEATP